MGHVHFVILKKLEDEYHFISVCKEYDILRQTLYNKVNEKLNTFNEMDNQGKLIFILKNEWKLLSKYLVSAWSKRNSKLYNTEET